MPVTSTVGEMADCMKPAVNANAIGISNSLQSTRQSAPMKTSVYLAVQHVLCRFAVVCTEKKVCMSDMQLVPG